VSSHYLERGKNIGVIMTLVPLRRHHCPCGLRRSPSWVELFGPGTDRWAHDSLTESRSIADITEITCVGKEILDHFWSSPNLSLTMCHTLRRSFDRRRQSRDRLSRRRSRASEPGAISILHQMQYACHGLHRLFAVQSSIARRQLLDDSSAALVIGRDKEVLLCSEEGKR